jgi:DNA repair photolyase
MHYKDAKSILSPKNGMNLYRGCTHGCIYCDSRSTCYGMDHAFEDVEAKRNAPELLEAALRRKRHRCMIATGSMSDPYLPLEDQEQLTRRCLTIIDRYGFGFAVQTKSDRVLRDLDLLKSVNRKARCVVQMTLTTHDEGLCRILEPGVCTTRRRVEVLNILRDEGIPTVVWLCPILPFINDTEENVRGILSSCFEAGVHGILCFGMGVTVREGDREYFYAKLDEHFPGMKDRYIHTFGNRYECSSPRNDELMKVFRDECGAHRVLCETGDVFAYLSAPADAWSQEQPSLF